MTPTMRQSRRAALGLIAGGGVLVAGCVATSVSQPGLAKDVSANGSETAPLAAEVEQLWAETLARFARQLDRMPLLRIQAMSDGKGLAVDRVGQQLFVAPSVAGDGLGLGDRAAVLAIGLAAMQLGPSGHGACRDMTQGDRMVRLLAGAGIDPRRLLGIERRVAMQLFAADTIVPIRCELRAMGYLTG
jgi:hypothetical protein